jgi:hypothetical protein
MSLNKAYLGRLTILNADGASAVSNILRARELAFAEAIVFYNPAAFTGTISVEVGPSEDTLAAGMKALYNNGSAVVLTAARVERHEVNGFESVRIKTSGTEAADRLVDVYAILSI